MATPVTPLWRVSGGFRFPRPSHMHRIIYFSYQNFTTRSHSGTFWLLQTLVFYIKTKNTQKIMVSYMKKMLEGEEGVFNNDLGVRTPVTSPANWRVWPVKGQRTGSLLKPLKTKLPWFKVMVKQVSVHWWAGSFRKYWLLTKETPWANDCKNTHRQI